MASSVRLLDLEPDVARFLSEEQRFAAREFSLPACEVQRDGDIHARLRLSDGFGAILIDGMLLQTLHVKEHATLRLIGPGTVLPPVQGPLSGSVGRCDVRPLTVSRLALLDDRFLVAVHRWPQLVIGLHAAMGEQSQLLAAHLAICQLPRAEDRLMTLMWLFAESWGRVTPAGISLSLSLSHAELGGLVGARRSTVTLALGALAERGGLVRRNGAWLIVVRPDALPDDFGEQPRRSVLVRDATRGARYAEAGSEIASRVGRVRSRIEEEQFDLDVGADVVV